MCKEHVSRMGMMKWRRRLLGLLCIAVLCLPIMLHQARATFSVRDASAPLFFLPIEKYPSSLYFSPALGDLDNDNQTVEVVWSNITHQLAFNNSGALLWILPTPWGLQYPCIGDFDRDGYTDDLLDSYNLSRPTLTAYNTSGATIATAVNASIHYANFTACNNVVAVGDFNRDGYADDIIVERQNGTVGAWYPYSCAYAYRNPSQTYWNLSYGNVAPYRTTVGMTLIGDVDGDGWADDVVITTSLNRTYALNETGGLLWEFPAGSGGMPYPNKLWMLFADFDADGKANEVALYSDPDRRVFAIDSQGHALWNFSIESSEAELAVGDIDHNGYEDNLVIKTGATGQNLTVLDAVGSLLWSTLLPKSIHTTMVRDINNNGYRDNIIVGISNLAVAFDNFGQILGQGGTTGLAYFGDFDSDGLTDDYISPAIDVTVPGGIALTLFRFDHLRVNFTYLPYSSYTFASDNRYSYGPLFRFNVSSQESYSLPFTANFTTPWHDTSMNTFIRTIAPGNVSLVFTVPVPVGATTPVELVLSYAGVPIATYQWEVSVYYSVGSPLIFYAVCAALAIVIGFRQWRWGRALHNVMFYK